jgi:2-deoxy-D-gluconate 3-dehydrogenase
MRVAVVTGGGGGIGRAEASRLRAGATDVVAERDLEVARAGIEALGAEGGGLSPLAVDVCDPASVREAFAAVAAQHGRLDVLVNCAGLSIRGPSEDYAVESWDTVLDTNLRGTFLCCQAAGRIMIGQRSGRIVNIGSTAAAGGFPGRAAYCASKAGVVALTQVLAVEWAPFGVRVNCVSPAHTRSALLEDAMRGGFVNQQDLLRRLPVGRLGEPEDIANVVAYLATSATEFLTGVNLYVDGGWTAQGII